MRLPALSLNRQRTTQVLTVLTGCATADDNITGPINPVVTAISMLVLSRSRRVNASIFLPTILIQAGAGPRPPFQPAPPLLPGRPGPSFASLLDIPSASAR